MEGGRGRGRRDAEEREEGGVPFSERGGEAFSEFFSEVFECHSIYPSEVVELNEVRYILCVFFEENIYFYWIPILN